MDPQEVRNGINQRIMSIEAPIPTVFSVADHTLTREGRNTPIRIYTPTEGDRFPIILLIHGGAWVAGNLDTHDNLARYLSSEAKAVVVSVGYLNAPEGKFPLPLEQCYDTLIWMTKHGPEIFADTSKLAIVGDSAGGNMAAALCLMNRDRGGPNIDLQVLINPAPDLTCHGTILRQKDSLDMLRWQATQYLSDPNDANNPYASPLIASDLSNLPPAVIILAEQDALRDAGQKYADRLQAAGIPTYVYCQQGVNHLAGHGAKAFGYARESLNVAVAQIRKTLKKSPSINRGNCSK
ncbi:MAG: alpha/beta hydrolase [Simkaniaceae bacterium]|nr:alpha/beta hydrolase [Simkaniaceae bacterium]